MLDRGALSGYFHVPLAAPLTPQGPDRGASRPRRGRAPRERSGPLGRCRQALEGPCSEKMPSASKNAEKQSRRAVRVELPALSEENPGPKQGPAPPGGQACRLKHEVAENEKKELNKQAALLSSARKAAHGHITDMPQRKWAVLIRTYAEHKLVAT